MKHYLVNFSLALAVLFTLSACAVPGGPVPASDHSGDSGLGSNSDEDSGGGAS